MSQKRDMGHPDCAAKGDSRSPFGDDNQKGKDKNEGGDLLCGDLLCGGLLFGALVELKKSTVCVVYRERG
jgi:hypothetical protein